MVGNQSRRKKLTSKPNVALLKYLLYNQQKDYGIENDTMVLTAINVIDNKIKVIVILKLTKVCLYF